MRVNNSRLHCPSYCFSKPPPPPSPPQTPSSPTSPVQHHPHDLETKDSHYHTACKSSLGSVVIEEKLCDEKAEIGENGVDGRKREFILKSSLKKTSTSASKDVVRECVKWMDDLGEELVEIREFEPIFLLVRERGGCPVPINKSKYYIRFSESGELDDAMNGYPTCKCVIL